MAEEQEEMQLQAEENSPPDKNNDETAQEADENQGETSQELDQNQDAAPADQNEEIQGAEVNQGEISQGGDVDEGGTAEEQETNQGEAEDAVQDATQEQAGEETAEGNTDDKQESNQENLQETENQPEGTEQTENQPEATEQIENQPEGTEQIENQPESTEQTENQLEATEQIETQPEATEQAENQPEATEQEVTETGGAQAEELSEQQVDTEQTGADMKQEVTEEQPPPSQEEESLPKVPEPTIATEERVSPPPPESQTTAAASTTPVPGQQQPEVNPYAPSPEPKYAKDALCTVKLMTMPSAQVHTMRCGLVQTLRELKELFSQEVKVSPDILMFMFDGKPLGNNVTLADLGVGPNGMVQLEITSSDPTTPLKPIRPKVEYQMPDVITVRVQTEAGQWHDVVVEIERATRKKPYLGGYRHKKTEVEYHHASAQTAQKPKPPSIVERYSRDTQTTEARNIVQQTTNDMSTQMTKIGVYVSNLTDKLVVPKFYTTAEEFQRNIYKRVLTIQKYYRRWLAIRYVEKVRSDKAKREEWERKEELRKRKEKEDRIKREFERRMNPKTKEDFDLLYHALEKWRLEELERINLELTGAERKAALCELLDQETQLIASIGRHKLDADTENKSKQIQLFLEKAAAPKKWKGPDGKNTEMDTPYTIRAQELKDIYNSINMKYLTQDERLDVLLTLKHTVKEHDCKLTREIIELIDREADLLMRCVKESNLDGLRKRISTLFLQYIKTPTFNPEAARLLKVPQDPSVLRRDIYFCPSCNQYKPSTEFQLSSNSKTIGRCNKCTKTDNDARLRSDYSHYRYMLKNLRRAEQNIGDGSKIAFLLQEGDLRYLVENVWNSQSILSAWEDVYDFVLVRWDKCVEWSPWNCILLTKEEAASHAKLENLEEAYGKALIHRVKHKHTLARNYFSRLPGMAEHMRRQGTSSRNNRGPSVSGKGLGTVQTIGVTS